MPRGDVLGIRGDESACIRIVVTSVEVVETEFGIVVVTAVAEGVICGGVVGACAFSNSILPRRAGAVNCQPKAGARGTKLLWGQAVSLRLGRALQGSLREGAVGGVDWGRRR